MPGRGPSSCRALGRAGGAGPAGSVMCTGPGLGCAVDGAATVGSGRGMRRLLLHRRFGTVPVPEPRPCRNRACRVSAPDEHRPRDAVVRTPAVPVDDERRHHDAQQQRPDHRAPHPTYPPRIGTTRSPTHRCPNDPENVQMNSTCRTAKMASWIQVCVMSPDPATGDQTPVTNATRSASTPSMSSATMRRPMRPTLRGPSSGRPRSFPGHPSGCAPPGFAAAAEGGVVLGAMPPA